MKQSVYMTWSKFHAAARYNLANSGIVGCSLTDLALSPDEILLNAPNTEGYPPLLEAIARATASRPRASPSRRAPRWPTRS